MSKKKKAPRLRVVTQFTAMHELCASPTQPMPRQKRETQLRSMWSGLASLEKAPKPSPEDWRVCSDAVNLMETLVKGGIAPIVDARGRTVASHWPDCDGQPVEIGDKSGLLDDAIATLGAAGERYQAGLPLRLDGSGMQVVRAVLEDYVELLEVLPERTIVRCHRITEKRIRDMLTGRYRTHAKVIDL